MQVSIIIPCHDVAAYADDCLRSAAGQSHADLDIIAVDDGSTDATGELLDRWAALDDRVRVVHQANRGLGAARNVGVDLAAGEALFFLDGDDFLPPDAISRLVRSTTASSSELVVGRIDVWQEGQTWRASQQRSIVDADRRSISLPDEPELIYDGMACSKLFRRSLWDRSALRFPEGVRFEDVVLVTDAYCGARGIDLVADTTYFWRRRTEGATSITQTVDPQAIADRFDALVGAHRRLVEFAEPLVVAEHVRKLVELDVRRAVRQGAEAGPDVMHAVVRSARTVLQAIPPRELDTTPPMMRAVCHLILRDDARGVALAERCFGGPDRSLVSRALAATHLLVRRPHVTGELVRTAWRRP